MGNAVIHYSDGGIAVATAANAFICVFREPATLPRLVEVRRAIGTHTRKWGHDTVSLSVLEPSAAASVPKDVRDETGAITRDYPSIAAAIVIEGSGFRAAAVRSVLAAIYLVARSPYPHKICEDIDVAARWLLGHAAGAGHAHFTPAGLRGAAEAARASIEISTTIAGG
jgi:hypothetical protein